METHAVALLADISNFTTVAERLQAMHGVDGPDRLSELLNVCFDLMIGGVESAGGDVASIQGDSLLAVWYLPDALGGDGERSELALRKANTCASAMHAAVAANGVLAREGLALHIGLAVGPMFACVMRTVGGRHQTLCGGDVVVDASVAMNQAAAGSTGASAGYWKARRSPPRGTLLGKDCVALDAEEDSGTDSAPHEPEADDDGLLDGFMPDALRGTAHAEQIALLAQSRVTTAMFCRIRGIDARRLAGFELLRTLIEAVRVVLRRQCGSLDKINVDEDGVFLVVLFGLPDAGGLGDAVGAVESALAVEAHVATLGHSISIGIATGRSNCSVIGNAARGHYTSHGAVPNLAARYMGVAGRGIVCDDETVRITEGLFEFERQRSAPLKGLSADSALHRLLRRRTTPAPSPRLSGRVEELRCLAQALASVRAHGGHRMLLVSGEQGVGKSLLAGEMRGRAQELGFESLRVSGDRLLSNVPLAPWAAVAGEAVPDAARLQTTFGGTPLLVVLEDAQWLDEASWSFARTLAQGHGRCVVLALLRSSRAPSARRLPDDAADTVVHLQRLAPEEAAGLVHACSGAATVSAVALEWLFAQSRGNPAVLIALARALRAAGALASARHAVVEDEIGALGRVALPAEVETHLTFQIDELPMAAQWLLKAASLSAHGLSVDDLLHATLWSGPSSRLEDSLGRLLDAGHLQAEEGTEPVRYRVTWPLMGRVATSLLSRMQRQAIHARLAQLRSDQAATDARVAAQVASHWAAAGQPGKAFVCFEFASREAMAESRFGDAAVQLESLRALMDGGLAVDALTRARVYVWLGQCHVSLGRLADGEACARVALRALGKPMPVAAAAWLWLFAGQLARWALPTRIRHRSGQETAPAHLSAAAVNVFAAASYFSASALPLVTSSLWAVNLARLQGRLHTAARPAAVVGYFFGLCRLHRAARAVFQETQAACEAAADLPGRHSMLGGQAMYELGFAQWDATRTHVGQALELCRQVGDPNDIRMALTIEGLMHHYVGDFARSYEAFERVHDSASIEANRQHMAWGAYAKAQNLIPMGRCREAAVLLQEAGDLLVGVHDKHSVLICSGLLSLAYLHCADYVRARETTLLAASQAAQTLPNNFGSFAGYYSVATTLIALWGRALCFAPAEVPGLKRETEVAMQHLARYAMLFPVARPRLALLRGWVHWRLGRRRRSHREWQRSLSQSVRLKMPYERALAHWSLQHSANPGQERDRHGRRAAELLDQCAAIPLMVEIGQPARVHV